jgi:hypothetical protein
VASLAQQVAREGWVLAYEDLFRRVAVVAALTFMGLALYWIVLWWRERAMPLLSGPIGAQP